MLLAAVGACGGDSGSSTNLDAFSTYWADAGTWCDFLAGCGVVTKNQCLATWPIAPDVKAAIVAAGIANADVGRCETAARLSDDCELNLTCAAYVSGTACMTEQHSFDTNCSLIQAAIDDYLMHHPRNPFIGVFVGTYDGSETGTFSGTAQADGSVAVTVVSASAGTLSGTGSISSTGVVALSAQGSVNGASFSIGFEGSIVAGAIVGTFSGSGTWTTGAGTSGDWSLQSGS